MTIVIARRPSDSRPDLLCSRSASYGQGLGSLWKLIAGGQSSLARETSRTPGPTGEVGRAGYRRAQIQLRSSGGGSPSGEAANASTIGCEGDQSSAATVA